MNNHLNLWYNSETASWGKDDIIDLLQEYDPAYEEHCLDLDVEGVEETVYFWGRRNGTSIYIYNDKTVTYYGNPSVPIFFDDPIVAILIVTHAACESPTDQMRQHTNV